MSEPERRRGVRERTLADKPPRKPRVAAEEQLIAIDRELRLRILGLAPAINREDLARRILEDGRIRPDEREFTAHLVQGRKRKRRRPKSVETDLKADSIAQLVFYWEALNPNVKREAALNAIAKSQEVSRSYIFEVLRKIDPERERIIKAAAAALAESRKVMI